MKDPYKSKPRPSTKIKENPKLYASRVIPFRYAFAGADFIGMLPLIRMLPQDGANIELILKKRQRVMSEIMQDLFKANS